MHLFRSLVKMSMNRNKTNGCQGQNKGQGYKSFFFMKLCMLDIYPSSSTEVNSNLILQVNIIQL